VKLFWTMLLISISAAVSAQVKVNQHKPAHGDYHGSSITLPRLGPSVQQRSNNEKIDVYQYAEPRAVDIHLQNAGEWKVKNDSWTWTVDVASPGAESINLGFTEYEMPEGASLKITSHQTGRSIGPFTISDNKDHGELWTPIMRGDKMTIELSVPAAVKPQTKLKLSSINHGFIDVVTRSLSGECNIDTRCGSEDGFSLIDRFRDQIQSVAAVSTRGGIFCTGFLVNNAQNDSKPYFILAAHCGITADNASSLVTYWNYENSNCRPINTAVNGSNGDGLLDQFHTGATMVATAVNGSLDPESVDFALLLLDDPVDPDFRPFYAGWDIRPILPDSSFVVHHSNGEEKRISFDYDFPQYSIFEGDTVFIRVNDWDLGTTEGGSSGAPQFNMQGKAIGFVSGGQAACGNDKWDEFGSLRRSFQGEGTAETSLVDWLDPAGTGQQVINGINGSFVLALSQFSFDVCGGNQNSITLDIDVDQNFQDQVTLSAPNLPVGVSADFNQNPIKSGGNTSMTLSGLNQLSSGNYLISISATDGNNLNANDILINIDAQSPNQIVMEQPIDISRPVSPVATFSWSDTQSSTYDFEISTDLSFADPIVARADITENQIATSVLEQNAEYFWRVRGKNLCQSGPWTAPVLFRTSGLGCIGDTRSDLNLMITEDRLDTTISVMTIEQDFIVGDVTIPIIVGEHTWSGDLSFTLISPSGTQVSLANSNCSSDRFQNFAIGFSDNGFSKDNIPCPFTDGMLYQPENPLSAFNGESASGEWQLMIIDQFFLDTGVFNEWSLQICGAEENNLFSELASSSLNLCNQGESISNEITVSSAFKGTVDLSILSNVAGLSFDLSPSQLMPGETSTLTVSGDFASVSSTTSIVVQATDGELSNSTNLILTLDDAPAPFDLISPFNESEKISGVVDFTWEAADNAQSYVLQISEDPLFTVIDYDIPETMTTSSFDLNQLQFGVQYYWRVNSIGIDCNRISDVYEFNVDLPNATYEIEGVGFEVYPNPVQDDVDIIFDQALIESTSLQLFDISGAVIHRELLQQGASRHALSLSDLTAGLYYLRIARQDETAIVKLVKQ